MISQSELKKILHYNYETGVFTWLIDLNKNIKVGAKAGRDHSTGYTQISFFGKNYLAHRLAWLYVYGYFPENQIDHINRNKKKNFIKNLREVSQTCNNRNSGDYSSNTSGVKGVGFDITKNKWKATIGVGGIGRALCNKADFVEAVAHRLAAEQCLNWEGCDSCSPAFQYMQEYLRGLK